jgi:hypothetical protein
VSDWVDFDTAVAEWRLGDRPAELLPTAAIEALALGCDRPSLVRLAGMERAGWSEIEPVVARVFDERDHALPTEQEAVVLVASAVARGLVAGTIEPEIGTDRLNTLAWRADGHPAFQELVAFIGLYGDLDAARAGHLSMQELRSAIVREARALLDRGTS